MKIMSRLITRTYDNKNMVATIHADNEGDALSYFKGRFNKKGVLVRKLKDNQFKIKEIRNEK